MRAIDRFIRVIPLAMLAAAGLSCGKDAPTGPTPANPAGALGLVLTSPNTDDGAVLLRIDAAVDSVTVPPGASYRHTRSEGATIRLLVRGPISGGSEIARVWVKDRGAVSASSMVIEQVAARTYQQRQLQGYIITLQAR